MSTPQPTRHGACLIIGAGDDTGGAIARAFAMIGYDVCLVRRPRHLEKPEALAAQIRADGGKAHPFGVDAREEEEMVTLVETIERDIGPIEVAIFNIGANVAFSIEKTTSRVFRKVWEMACFAGFLTGREVAKRMMTRQRGTIIFTGATASVRSGKNYSAFANAKFALRALAQSMARELGPQNIHVAHVVVDSAINSNFIRNTMPDVDDAQDQDAILSPVEIAKNYVWLHRQQRSVWTQELDIRPWKEIF